MNKVWKDEPMRVPIKSWVTDLDAGAYTQAMHLSQLPFIFKHVALMPDAHMGYGMPIGGVVVCKEAIIPNAVGVDIGCGVQATRLPMNRDTHPEFGEKDIKRFMSWIRNDIPLGYKKHKRACLLGEMPELGPVFERSEYPVILDEFSSACKSLGTLGGGNHFIEIQCDKQTNIWIMIHSGSRNLGKKVADYHNKVAVRLNEDYHSSVPSGWELAFLPLYSEEARVYMNEMEYCVKFAKANRDKMMKIIVDMFYRHMKLEGEPLTLDVAHNYATVEHHFGHNVMVHRKGATRARMGDIGIIPASQGSKSYIVAGKGNPESFHSCSHGAGRAMGRNEARKKLDLDHEKKILDDQGIIHSIRGVKDLDEASSAYKDINIVMEDQKDLVEIAYELQPLAVIKG